MAVGVVKELIEFYGVGEVGSFTFLPDRWPGLKSPIDQTIARYEQLGAKTGRNR